MKLLHLDSSILEANSISRSLSAAVVERLRNATPGLEITYRDLAVAPLAHFSGAHLAAAYGPSSGASPESDVAAGADALAEFLAADIVVIGAPMYNFTIPSQLKAWIDRILVKGKTFQYSEAGPAGLAGGKRVIIAMSRGGFYGADTPTAAGEHVETYLRWVFGFIGIKDVEFVSADGVNMPPIREKAIADALVAARALPGERRAA
jgi:FMN-dependent NADH-azoreductase